MASIVPQNFLHITEESEFHMALAHLVGTEGYETYTKFFKTRSKKAFCILDNGVIEGSPMPIETILEKAELINADEIVLPDAYKEGQKTIDMIDHAITCIENKYGAISQCPFRLMAVPQGDTKEEWLTCAEILMNKYRDKIHTIGIPKHLIDTCQERDARLLILADLSERTVLINEYDIHLLGCWKTPLEVLTIAKASEQAIIPYVRSCDSAIPYVYARNGLRFSDDDRPDKDPIDFKLGHCNETLLTFNVLAWNCIGDPTTERGVWFL